MQAVAEQSAPMRTGAWSTSHNPSWGAALTPAGAPDTSEPRYEVQSAIKDDVLRSVIDSATRREEESKVTQTPLNERVAKVEGSIETLRAEIRASNAETRQAILTAVEGLRADNANLRADVTKDVLGVRIWVLASALVGSAAIIGTVLSTAGWIAKQIVGPILQHLVK